MKLNNKQQLVIVAALSATAIAFFSYRIYKTVKKVKKEMADQEHIELVLEVDDKLKDLEKRDEEMEEYEEPELGELELAEGEVYRDYEEEGVEELRFPPNSEEALHQYKEMRLAEFDAMSFGRRQLYRLFKIPFQPSNNADSIIMGNMIHDRKEFFGRESIHNTDITVADLLLYFGNLADFDLDQGVEFWTNQFLFNLDFDYETSDMDLNHKIDALVDHELWGPEGWGLFGLDEHQRNDAIGRSVRGYGGKLSFLIQFHVFLERALDEWVD